MIKLAVTDAVHFRADYLRSFRKQALEILIIIGGKELWLEMNKVSNDSLVPCKC